MDNCSTSRTSELNIVHGKRTRLRKIEIGHVNLAILYTAQPLRRACGHDDAVAGLVPFSKHVVDRRYHTTFDLLQQLEATWLLQM